MAAPLLTTSVTGNPFVEVFFPNLAPGTASLTIYRLSEEREWLVRGGVGLSTGVAALDFEAPFKTPSTYRAEQFDAVGNSLGFTESATTIVDYDGTVVHNPLVPASLWAHALVGPQSLSPVRRPTPGELLYVEDASVGTWIGTRRQGIRGLDIELLTTSIEAGERLQAMLGAYQTRQVGVLCIRTSSTAPWPRTFFAQGDLEQNDRDQRFGGTWLQFNGSVDEVQPPFPGLLTPLLTYDDLDAFGNYTAQDAGWLTYTDRDRAYELAGLAG